MALDLGTLVGYLELDDSQFRGPIQELPGEVRKAGSAAESAARDTGSNINSALTAGLNMQAVGGQLQAIGGSLTEVGKGLTKSITAPAVGAAGAVAGITAAFGWGRLVAVDTAQSQLRGLGYETEDVERISKNLSTALEGGMMTMAEATAAAASGMAAGVEEGKELTRYIQLLDAAVVGGTGSFDEMNKIFSVTQENGYLARNEFDMMAQRMPGFSSAVQKAMGVTREELNSMLAAGEVTTEDFLSIMDDFAGDMATEYAKSWEGMVQNTKAYIGIIGEQMLGGVFEESKESIGEFLEYLSSDEVQTWAAEAGAAIGEWFSDVVDKVRSVIDWWMNLDGSTQRLIGTLAGIAVAAGPVLMVLGKITTGAGAVVGGLGKFTAFMGGGSAAATKLGGALRFLMGPWGLLIAAIATAVAMSPELQAVLGDLAGVLGGVLMEVMTALTPVFEVLGDVAGMLAGVLADVLLSIVDAAMPLIDVVVMLIEALAPILPLFAELIGTLLPPLVELLMSLIGPILELVAPLIDLLAPALELVATVIGWVVGAIGWLVSALVGLVTGNEETYAALAEVWEAIKGFFGGIADWWSDLWETVTSFAKDAWNGLINWFKGIPGWIQGIFAAAGQWLLNAGSNIVSGLRTGVTNMWNSFISFLRGLPGQIIGFFAGAGSWLWNAGKNIVQGLLDGVKSLAGSIGNFFLDLLPGWIVGPFKAALGISSPSKLFAQYGRDIVDGVIVGADDGQPALDARMRSLVDAPAAPSIGVSADRLADSATATMSREDERWRTFEDKLDELTDAIKDQRPIEVHSNDPEEVATVVGEHLR